MFQITAIALVSVINQNHINVRIRFGDKIIQNSASKFSQEVKLKNYRQKSQINRWVYKFQATGSVNDLNKKAENPSSVWKLSDNMDAV